MRLALRALLSLALVVATNARAEERSITNASYDVTREFYERYDRAFAAYWKATTGETIAIHASHGGSSKQRAVASFDQLYAVK